MQWYKRETAVWVTKTVSLSSISTKIEQVEILKQFIVKYNCHILLDVGVVIGQYMEDSKLKKNLVNYY